MRTLAERPNAPDWIRQRLNSVPATNVATKATRRVPAALPTETESRDLTAAEGAFLANMPDDPAVVSEGDAKVLLTLRRVAKSPTERQIVDAKLGPLRDRIEALEKLDALESELLRIGPPTPDPTTADDWSKIRGDVAEKILVESPELHREEAEARAARLVREEHGKHDLSADRLRTRAEIGELVREHGFTSSFENASSWGTDRDDNRTVSVST